MVQNSKVQKLSKKIKYFILNIGLPPIPVDQLPIPVKDNVTHT